MNAREDREELFRYCRDFFTLEMNNALRTDYIKNIIAMEPEQQKGFYRVCKQLIKEELVRNGSYTRTIKSLIQYLGEMENPEEIVAIFEEHFDPSMDTYKKLRTLADIQKLVLFPNAEEAITCFKRILPSRMINESVTHLVDYIKALKKPQEVLAIAERFFLPDMDTWKKMTILNHMKELPALANVDDILTCLERIVLQSGTYSISTCKLIECLKGLKNPQKTLIMSEKFFLPDMLLDTKIEILNELEELSLLPYAEDAIQCFERVALQELYPDDAPKLAECLKGLENLKEVVAISEKFFKEAMPVKIKIIILNEIQRLFYCPNAEKAITCFERFIQPGMPTSHIKSFIDVLEDFENLEEGIAMSEKFFHSEMHLDTKITILSQMKRLYLLPHAKEVIQCFERIVGPGISDLDTIKLFIECLKDLKSPEDLLIIAEEIFTQFDTMDTSCKIELMIGIDALTREERASVVHYSKKFLPVPLENISKLFNNIAAIPEKERSFLDLSIYTPLGDADPNVLLFFYVLPTELRTEENIRLLYENTNQILQDGQLSSRLLEGFQAKLSDYSLPQHTLYTLANYIISLNLPEEALVLQLALDLDSIFEIEGEKNPFTVFNKHKLLRDIPVEYVPFASQEIPLIINMDMLQQIAKVSSIKEKDLPEIVTKQAFEEFLASFTRKVEENPEEAKEAFDALMTSIEEIEEPIHGDPQQYIMNLINISGPISDVQGKWYAILYNILDKSPDDRPGKLFNEQQEVFITTMMNIQHCMGGKKEGIAKVYNDLDNKYKYKTQIASPEEQLEFETKKEPLDFLRKCIQNTNSLIRQERAQTLIDRYNENTYDGSMHFSKLFGLDAGKYIVEDEDDYDIYRLNEEGAYTALDILQKDERKNISNLLADEVREFIETIISSDTFLRKLAGNYVDHGVHFTQYLRNYVGHLIGVTNEIIFDRYTTVLTKKFLRQSRENILYEFFQECSPERLIAHIQKKVDAENETVRFFLNKPEFWEDGRLSLLGAQQLLEESEILK